MKTITLFVIALIVVGAGVYFFTQVQDRENGEPDGRTGIDTIQPQAGEQPGGTQEPEQNNEPESVLGTSGEGRDITAYHYGLGEKELLFVGGIHGGYEWNTVLVAYELVDYLKNNPGVVPENVRITVIPVLNPDGLYKVVGSAERFAQADVPSSQDDTVPGRFNANNVDLNRNFDCDWQPNALWQSTKVSGGSEAFSEPESQALRDYVEANKPEAVVVWYSAVARGGVFASNCHNGVLPETNEITNVYARASGYPAYQEFNFYEITGDAVNWLAKNNIPAISVLLSTHQDVEWNKNREGIEALFEYYAE